MYVYVTEQTCRSLLFQGYFYDSFTNLCVNLIKKPMTQAQAARACALDGASLMIVDDSKKQDFLIYWIFSHRGMHLPLRGMSLYIKRYVSVH